MQQYVYHDTRKHKNTTLTIDPVITEAEYIETDHSTTNNRII
jgi:hypothetical protein